LSIEPVVRIVVVLNARNTLFDDNPIDDVVVVVDTDPDMDDAAIASAKWYGVMALRCWFPGSLSICFGSNKR
jgi:hypothetical protein